MFETQLNRMVSEKANQLLNAMLDGEAHEINGTGRYERSMLVGGGLRILKVKA